MKKLADRIRRVGLVANTEKAACAAVVRRAAALIRATGRAVTADAETARYARLRLDGEPAVDSKVLARGADLLMVFGGDGTMLRVARAVVGARTPIFGVNTGSLGFLTAVPAAGLDRSLQRIWEGDLQLETRPVIEARGHREGASMVDLALNDFVITRGAAPRLVDLEVSVDGELMTRYRADGLIICSPTGSTAYSLAAGGAVVSPGAEVLTLTPICPHTLSNRSVIVGMRSVIRVKVLSERVETVLTADGQETTPLSGGDVVTVRRSRESLRLLHLGDRSFFKTLRTKLNWSGSNV